MQNYNDCVLRCKCKRLIRKIAAEIQVMRLGLIQNDLSTCQLRRSVTKVIKLLPYSRYFCLVAPGQSPGCSHSYGGQ